jgi:signal recognition particle receptor subunit beta
VDEVCARVPEVSPEALRSLLAGCAWAGMAIRARLYDATGQLVELSAPTIPADRADTNEPAAHNTLPPALTALARLLRLLPARTKRADIPPANRSAGGASAGEERIVICGDYAAGKTTALKTLLEADALTMDVENQDPAERSIKSTTTVGFDFGTLSLGPERLHLYAVPGQERFRIIASSLIEGAHGALVLVDGSEPSAETAVKTWVALIRDAAPETPIVIALNRVIASTPSLRALRASARSESQGPIAVVTADPRRAADMLGCLRLLVLLRHPEIAV